MDYTNKKTMFKIKKALRYVMLYGVRRTLAKIRGQYHMKKIYAALPNPQIPSEAGGHVGLIGCGNFAFSNIAYYLKRNYGRVIRGAMDVNINRAASLFEAYGLRYFTDNAEKLINDPAIDIIYIASNHASHAEYAIQALDVGKSVHIEKPHVVTTNQLLRLCKAMSKSKGKVRLGFNRPFSNIGTAIRTYIYQQSGASMFNWFIAGHEISPDHWYFKEEEGGRVLGNLCHWTDFIYQLVPSEKRYPITINPTRGTKSDSDIAVAYVFGDESIAAITFSAKGHTFEGVRERFAAHRGNALISMDDFKNLTVDIVDKKYRHSQLFRDHGHEVNIVKSYEMVHTKSVESKDGCTVDYVWETAELFLKTREAFKINKRIVLQPFANAL